MARDVTAERLVAMASHDLSEPLLTVEGFARLLRERAAGRLEERDRALLDEVVAGTERMRRMVDALLGWARAQSGEAGRVRVDVGELVGEAVAALDARVRSTGAVVEVGELPVVWADRERLGLVFQNLIANALVHAGGAGRPPVVEICASPLPGPGPGWLFTVADRGPGVPSERRATVFELFSREPGGEGSGIGLAVCAQAVAAHGGRIWVDDREGGGACFRFTLHQRGERG